MTETGLYEPKSTLLKWCIERYMYSDRDTLNIWVLHGLLILAWILLPIGLLQELYLKRKLTK
jgi:hypothetical protein